MCVEVSRYLFPGNQWFAVFCLDVDQAHGSMADSADHLPTRGTGEGQTVAGRGQLQGVAGRSKLVQAVAGRVQLAAGSNRKKQAGAGSSRQYQAVARQFTEAGAEAEAASMGSVWAGSSML